MGIISDVEIINAKVMHHRLKPKVNKFLYSVYYLCLPMHMLNVSVGNWILGYNRFAIFSFFAKDHGVKDIALIDWIKSLLSGAGIKGVDVQSIKLITMPRILGYVFNPVSFWIIPNSSGEMIAVICEVNNTFGERHVYVCARKDGGVIAPSDILEAKKIFHVSPFLLREGGYIFKFSFKETIFSALINYTDDDKSPILLTSVIGTRKKASFKYFLFCFFAYPFMTFKVIFLIHWQAIIILTKGIKYISKPEQLSQKHSITESNL
jgi:DUF1365 family protein